MSKLTSDSLLSYAPRLKKIFFMVVPYISFLLIILNIVHVVLA
jgi:hypothetical protein